MMTDVIKPKSFKKEDLYNIARGACLLGSGGGGTYSSAMNLVNNFTENNYYKTTEVKVIKKSDLVEEPEKDKNGYGVVVAYIGAPQSIEELKYPYAAVKAVEHVKKNLSSILDKHSSKNQTNTPELKYLVPAEIGAFNSIVPCLVASKLGLTVIDCDGAGRAVPELTMTTFAANNISPDPTFLASKDGNIVELNVYTKGDTKQEAVIEQIEKLARPVIGLEQFHEAAGLAIWIMSPADLQKAIQIEGTLCLARDIGKCIKTATAKKIVDSLNKKHIIVPNSVKKEKENLKAFIIFKGTFVEKGCRTVSGGGFDHGIITIRGNRVKKDGTNYTYNQSDFLAIFVNETLIAWDSEDNFPIAMAPDSIAYYVENKQKVYSNGDLIKNGKLIDALKSTAEKKVNVAVIGIAANSVMRETEENIHTSKIALAKNEKGEIMRSFKKALADIGYAGKYVKLEDI